MKKQARHDLNRHRAWTLAPLLFAAALLVASPAARAQKTEADVVKELKLAVKQTVADATNGVNKARTTYYASLIAFEALVKSGDFTEPMVHDLFEASIDFEQELRGALEHLTEDLAGPASSSLGSYPGVQGLFPTEFYPGTGGPIDVARGAVESRIEKAVVSARKRVAKLTRLIEEQAGYAVTVNLDVPLQRPIAVGWTKGSSFATFAVPLTLDVVVAGSSLALVGDGVLYASGLAGTFGEGTCTLVFKTPYGVLDSEIAAIEFDLDVPVAMDRWSVQFGGGEQGLAEGLYCVLARLGATTAVADIGLR